MKWVVTLGALLLCIAILTIHVQRSKRPLVESAAAPSGVISGRVMSGEIPVVAANVTLYGAVGICSPDPCSTQSMAVAKTRTDSQGRFTIDLSEASVQVPLFSRGGTGMAREWPAPGSMYLIAQDGDAGGGANPVAALMLALGDTNGVHSITINEITTVIAALAYARSMSDHDLLLSGDASVKARLSNGGWVWLPPRAPTTTMSRALVDPERGALRPIFSEGVNSPALVNTLADVVAACVRSGDPNSPIEAVEASLADNLRMLSNRLSSGSYLPPPARRVDPCEALFAAAPAVGPPRVPDEPTPAPADTIAALENIALWPQRNVEQLFALLPTKPPYLPILTSAPQDFMITLNFARGGFNHPAGIAIDPADKAVWIANEGGNSVIELGTDAGHFGLPLSPPGGFTGGGLRAPKAIRFIPVAPERGTPATPSLWVANRLGDSLTEILLPPPSELAVPKLRRITGNGLKAPVDLAEFGQTEHLGSGNAVVAVANSRANVVSLFNAIDGSPCGSPVRIEGLKDAEGIGHGVDGDIWIADAGANALFMIKRPDAACRGAMLLGKITGGGLSAPRFLAWIGGFVTLVVTNPGNNSVAGFAHRPEYGGTPRAVGGSPFTGGGLKSPAGIASGSYRNAWVANNAPGANSISEISTDDHPTGTPLSPPGGFSGAGLDRPYGIAVDDNGNVWVTNQAGNSVTVFIGADRAGFFYYRE